MTEEKPIEFVDDESTFHSKMNTLKHLIEEADDIMVYTGAGISTASKISDYRGDSGLKWNRAPMIVIGMQERELDYKMPSYSHVAIADLVKKNVVYGVVTSNHDNLHQKAGTPVDRVVDLFGNVYVEECGKCGMLYRRSVIVPSLSRSCNEGDCDGRLHKTGTRMNAMTPEVPLETARRRSKRANLALVFGSSMTISPFCELPGKADKMVIVNLQETPYDDQAELKIHSYIDDVFREITSWYDLPIETFAYTQNFAFSYENTGGNDWHIELFSELDTEQPQCVEDVKLKLSGKTIKMEEGTYCFSKDISAEFHTSIEATIFFQEQYEVEPLRFSFSLDKDKSIDRLMMEKTIIY